jgi:polyisoprenoid-binding protein YceI
MRTKALFSVLVLAVPVSAAENTIDLDPGHTAITFTLGDVLHTVHGTFKLKRGCLKFDSATGKAAGEIVVDVASGNSGNGARDKRMHKDILESARFPEAVFTPDHVTGELAAHGTSEIDVHGTFQIHGSTHDITMHFRADAADTQLTASTSFEIPYVQWGMKNPSNFLLKVNDKVKLDVQALGRLQ